MRLSDLSDLAVQLDGVTERRSNGLLQWRYQGRLVARQLDHSHVVIRASFDFKDLLLQSFPETFAVPNRFRKHMMIVADLDAGNADAVEHAIIGAWEFQSARSDDAGPRVALRSHASEKTRPRAATGEQHPAAWLTGDPHESAPSSRSW
jgi:hypothetical protein